MVAAMTMPVLVGNYQKKQMVNQLKKAYSELNQAVRISEAKYGTLETWDFKDFPTANDRTQYFADNYLFPNIKVIKKCMPSTSECWADEIYKLNGDPSTDYLTNNTSGHGSFVTSSGYSVYFWLHGAGNGGWLYIDINGAKKPNRLGKDIFAFLMSWGYAGQAIATNTCLEYKLGLNPLGLHCKSITANHDELINGSVNVTNLPSDCKKDSIIVIDGWEISKDYPW